MLNQKIIVKFLIVLFILINTSILVWAINDLYKISYSLRPVLNSEKFRDAPGASLQVSKVLNNMSAEEKINNVDKTIDLYMGLSQFSVDRNIVIFELFDAVEEYNIVVIILILSNAALFFIGYRIARNV